MDAITMSQATIWLSAGFLLLAIEAIAFGFTSGLLLFGSLGAIATGILLWFGLVPDNFVAAVACFAVVTAATTAILWHPLKRMQSGTEMGQDRSSDLIGHTFVVSSDVSISNPGTERYSSINWRVEPSKEMPGAKFASGTRVKVTAVTVGVFFVEPAEL